MLAGNTSVTPLFKHVSGSKNNPPSLRYLSESLQSQGVWFVIESINLNGRAGFLFQARAASRSQCYSPLVPGQQSLSENANSPPSQSLLHLQGKETVTSVLYQKPVSLVRIPTVGNSCITLCQVGIFLLQLPKLPPCP